MKKLIVNADDFGLHTQINNGIIKGYKEGFITSTSLMCSAPCYDEAVALAEECPGLGIGIHLTLVGGVRSVLDREKIPSLVDGDGRFLPDYVAFARRFYTGQIRLQEIEAELRAQIEKGLQSGLAVTHIDSHQHTHVLPLLNGLVTDLCAEYKIKKIRNPQEGYFFSGGFTVGIGRKIGRSGLSFCAAMAKLNAAKKGIVYPQHFFGMLAGGHLDEGLVANILNSLPEGTSEIMTHPGLDKKILDGSFTWGYNWENELNAFLSDKNKHLLEKNRITLINFGGLI